MGRDVPATGKQIEILVVESNPADTRLTEIAFKAAGLTRAVSVPFPMEKTRLHMSSPHQI